MTVIGDRRATRAADLEAGRRKAEPCAACHGPDGNATIPGHAVAGRAADSLHALAAHQVPRRAAQGSADVALRDESERHRHGGSGRLLRGAAAEAARRAPIDPAKVAAGPAARRPLSLHVLPPARARRAQQMPRLAGQDFAYLLKLLRGFKAKTASDLDGTMTMAAQPLDRRRTSRTWPTSWRAWDRSAECWRVASFGCGRTTWSSAPGVGFASSTSSASEPLRRESLSASRSKSRPTPRIPTRPSTRAWS